ncbi:hypothetical protein HYU15_02340 [Candidatus Woesearchaeota archaeon]|nr:hypothetical protein [Candidatus Woesearchaeota archaeon]
MSVVVPISGFAGLEGIVGRGQLVSFQPLTTATKGAAAYLDELVLKCSAAVNNHKTYSIILSVIGGIVSAFVLYATKGDLTPAGVVFGAFALSALACYADIRTRKQRRQLVRYRAEAVQMAGEGYFPAADALDTLPSSVAAMRKLPIGKDFVYFVRTAPTEVHRARLVVLNEKKRLGVPVVTSGEIYSYQEPQRRPWGYTMHERFGDYTNLFVNADERHLPEVSFRVVDKGVKMQVVFGYGEHYNGDSLPYKLRHVKPDSKPEDARIPELIKFLDEAAVTRSPVLLFGAPRRSSGYTSDDTQFFAQMVAQPTTGQVFYLSAMQPKPVEAALNGR